MSAQGLMSEFLACKYDATNLTNLWANKRVSYAQLAPAQVFENINGFVDNFKDNSMVENGVFFNDSFRYTRDINPDLIKQQADKGTPFEQTPDLIDLATDAIERGGPEAANLGLSLIKKLINKIDPTGHGHGNCLGRVMDFAGFVVAQNPNLKEHFVIEIEKSMPKICQLDSNYSMPILNREQKTVSKVIDEKVVMLLVPVQGTSSNPKL